MTPERRITLPVDFAAIRERFLSDDGFVPDCGHHSVDSIGGTIVIQKRQEDFSCRICSGSTAST